MCRVAGVVGSKKLQAVEAKEVAEWNLLTGLFMLCLSGPCIVACLDGFCSGAECTLCVQVE